MGDDEEGLFPVLQVVVEPDDGVQVEVVGRLVQHQQRRLDEERARQRYPHPPTAGELVGGSVLFVGYSVVSYGSYERSTKYILYRVFESNRD